MGNLPDLFLSDAPSNGIGIEALEWKWHEGPRAL
jgi:hypothetical protein